MAIMGDSDVIVDEEETGVEVGTAVSDEQKGEVEAAGDGEIDSCCC